MRGPRNAVAVLAALALAGPGAVLVGCGDDEEPETTVEAPDTTTSSTTTGEEPIEVEGGDPPAEIPASWETFTNESAGFTIGVPPNWDTQNVKGADGTTLTSPDGLVTITVTADRTPGASDITLDEFAEATLEALGSSIDGSERFRGLEVFDTAEFRHQYEAIASRAVGKPASTGIPEKVLGVAIRPNDAVTYIVVVRENADQESTVADRDTVKRIVRSLRTQPPAA